MTCQDGTISQLGFFTGNRMAECQVQAIGWATAPFIVVMSLASQLIGGIQGSDFVALRKGRIVEDGVEKVIQSSVQP